MVFTTQRTGEEVSRELVELQAYKIIHQRTYERKILADHCPKLVIDLIMAYVHTGKEKRREERRDEKASQFMSPHFRTSNIVQRNRTVKRGLLDHTDLHITNVEKKTEAKRQSSPALNKHRTGIQSDSPRAAAGEH